MSAQDATPMTFAPSIERIRHSISSAAAQRARELAASGRRIINLTAGEPDFDTPDNIKAAAIQAMSRGQTKYTNVDGTPELKQAIRRKFERDNALAYTNEQITVANGAKQVIFNAMMATLRDGDEVIVPAPYWVSYPEIVKFCGAIPKFVSCPQSTGFKLQPQALADAITPRTRWLILNSPSNPTGAAYTADELAALTDVLHRHRHVWILSDDVYEHLLFDGATFATPAAVDPAVYDRTLTVNGMSKAYCMTGWRVGYAGGPKALIREMSKLQSQATSCASSISQAAAVEALNGSQDGLSERAKAYQQRRNALHARLSAVLDPQCPLPQGAFYMFPSCRALIGKKTAAGHVLHTDEDVALYLLEAAGIAVVQGAAYGLSPFLRFSYATSQEQLDAACSLLEDVCRQLG